LIRGLAVVLGVAVATAALAQDEPETVYAKFHRAGLAADYETMLKYGTVAKEPLPPAERKRLLQVLARVLPRAYSVVEKTVDEGGKRAVLRLRGRQPAVAGTITFVKEKGEWKVDEANWAER
jgi:hypothetical protein